MPSITIKLPLKLDRKLRAAVRQRKESMSVMPWRALQREVDSGGHLSRRAGAHVAPAAVVVRLKPRLLLVICAISLVSGCVAQKQGPVESLVAPTGPSTLRATSQDVPQVPSGRRRLKLYPVSIDRPAGQKDGFFSSYLVRPGMRRAVLGVRVEESRAAGIDVKIAEAALSFAAAAETEYIVDGAIHEDIVDFWISEKKTRRRVSDVVSTKLTLLEHVGYNWLPADAVRYFQRP